MATLDELLREAMAAVEAMTSEQREAMLAAQRESLVRGEMGWPKAKFKWIGGVKVYESWEDYYND